MISLKHIYKTFSGKVVLDDISIDFPKGQTSVILGHSGSGKSTLLRSINLLEIPESGILRIENDIIIFQAKPLKSKQISSIRAHSAFVFQHFNLFLHLNALQNITAPLSIVHKRPKNEATKIAYELLEKVGLKGYEKSYPNALSGGQAQRVAIARALAINPDFLLADEPTTALDPELTNEVLGVFKDLSNEGKSIIIVTHNLAFAKMCAKNIIFLESGKIAFNGSTQDFFNSSDERIIKFIKSENFS